MSRQELALRPVRGFGGVLGRSQIGLRHLEICRVPHDAQNLDRFAAGVAVDPALRVDPMHRRVGPADPALQAQCASPECIFEGLVSRRPVFGHDRREEMLATPFTLNRRVAEYLVVPQRPDQCVGRQIQLVGAHPPCIERKIRSAFGFGTLCVLCVRSLRQVHRQPEDGRDAPADAKREGRYQGERRLSAFDERLPQAQRAGRDAHGHADRQPARAAGLVRVEVPGQRHHPAPQYPEADGRIQ